MRPPANPVRDGQARYYEALRWVCVAVVLLLALAEPVSHAGLVRGWSDQSKFYDALTAALHGSPNPLVDEGWVGPGYIAAAVILNRIVTIRIEDTLVLLNRLCYLGTISVVAIFVMFFWHPREPQGGQARLLSLMCGFVYLLCVLNTSGLTFFSDVPWSHFVSAFLIVLSIALVLQTCSARSTAAKATLLIASGMSLGALIGVRLFDGIVVAISLLIAYGVRTVWCANRVDAVRAFLAGSLIVTVSGLAVFAGCLILSGAKRIPLFYLSIPMLPALTKLYPATFFSKFLQIFVDPSFNTADNPFIFRSALVKTWAPNLGDWRIPLLLQSPILLYGLAIFLPVAVGTFALRRKDASGATASLRAMLITSIALLIGYTTTFVAGSPHLKFGMIRDYMPVIWCLVLVGAPSAGWLWTPKRLTRISAVLLSACVFILLLGECAASFGMWPTYPSHHIAQAIVKPHCERGYCTLSLTYVNPQGRQRRETKDVLFSQLLCDGAEEDLALVGPNYSFREPECPVTENGVILPRLAGLAGIPAAQVPASFRFQLPGPDSSTGKYGRTYTFGLGTTTHSLLVSGWSGDERGFVWSDAKQAEIDIPYDSEGLQHPDIDLELTPFVAGIATRQTVIVSFDNQPPQRFVLSKALEHIHFSPVMPVSGNLKISLSLPNAVSPLSLGLSPDPRVLAVALRRITISAAFSK